MEIQDLGAIGEFISSVVIVGTLIVLIYEVRGTRQATLQANAQERARKRDSVFGAAAETPSLAEIWAKADDHLGDTRTTELANEFGLNANELRQLRSHFMRMFANWRDAYESELADPERRANDFMMSRVILGSAAVRKHYETIAPHWRIAGSPVEPFVKHVDRLLADSPHP